MTVSVRDSASPLAKGPPYSVLKPQLQAQAQARIHGHMVLPAHDLLLSKHSLAQSILPTKVGRTKFGDGMKMRG